MAHPTDPARVGVSVCDIAAGMNAYQAILRALIGRGRTGEGRAIEVSLYHAMADWMNVPYLQHVYGGATPTRQGLQHPTIAPYGAFTCADGKAVLHLDPERAGVASPVRPSACSSPELAERPGFASNTESAWQTASAVDGRLADFFAKHSREENIDLLAAADIAYGRLSDLDDLEGSSSKPADHRADRTRRHRPAGTR